MPNKMGRFHLYSDTSKYATGSALYQIQGSKPKLIAYASKRLPEAAKNYSITELELCGLAINIKVKVKVLFLYSATQLNQMVSVALYNLTPGRGLTKPWCEPSP